jgi:hypothetical protein
MNGHPAVTAASCVLNMVNFFEIVKAVFLLTFPLNPDLMILWDIPTAKSAWQK